MPGSYHISCHTFPHMFAGTEVWNGVQWPGSPTNRKVATWVDVVTENREIPINIERYITLSLVTSLPHSTPAHTPVGACARARARGCGDRIEGDEGGAGRHTRNGCQTFIGRPTPNQSSRPSSSSRGHGSAHVGPGGQAATSGGDQATVRRSAPDANVALLVRSCLGLLQRRDSVVVGTARHHPITTLATVATSWPTFARDRRRRGPVHCSAGRDRGQRGATSEFPTICQCGSGELGKVNCSDGSSLKTRAKHTCGNSSKQSLSFLREK